MAGQMQGRVALVTGGGSGLGAAVCRDFAEQGAHVLVADVNAEGAARTAEAIGASEAAGSAEALTLDITDRQAVDQAIAEASKAHGAAFDCLVNNAGTDRGADLVDVDDDQWHGVFAVNLHGPMYLSRAFVRHLQQVREGAEVSAIGDIVCVVSISALTVGAGAGAYNSSKAAVLKLTEVMQTEARERGWPARVSAINPAAMATPMMDQWGLPEEKMMDPAIVAGLIRTAVTLPPEVVLQNLVVTTRVEQYPR
ncbi:SDR family oxidoreductase [Nocardioides sp. SYSU DS0663]|uniref:SDR family oxidoreductase n=1 Tax=Nocardioides sp. SYSU DS0663 TaxID=3416445 RepID=UPI003F4C8652